MTEPGEVEPAVGAAEPSSGSSGTSAKGAKAARKAEKSIAKEARRAAKAAGKAARRAEASAAKAEATAAKAARKAEASAAKAARKAEKASAKAARKAEKASARAATKVEKAAAKEARSSAKAAARADKDAAATAHQEAEAAAKIEADAAEASARETKAAARGAKAAAKADRASEAGVSALPASTGAVLEEAAGLMRQAGEPAGARILDRAPSVEAPVAELAPEPEPAPEPVAEKPEPEPVAEEPVAEKPEPEPVAEEPVAEEPEPEPVAVFKPEPEPETVAEQEPEPVPTLAGAGSGTGADDQPLAGAEATGVELEPTGLIDDLPLAGAEATDDGDSWSLGGDEELASEEPAAPEPQPVEIPEGATIHAAIDVGSTSVHLLVAAIDAHRVVPLIDESAFLGLGDRVATDGHIGQQARDELVEVLATYADRAREAGAREVTIVGTEPMRRAADAAAVVRAVEYRTGAAFHVVDHDEEGLLMVLGVTLGKPLGSSVLVVDVGGGSTEFVAVDQDGHSHASGLPLGANRLTRELVRFDPPSLSELEALKARVREILADAPDVQPGELVGVGGTVSNLLKLLPATAVDRALTRRRLTVALAMLTVERSAEAAERHLLRPERARILPAGSIIIDAILERYGADRIRVSDEGIREGLALAVATAGPAWRDRLPGLARGWKDAQPAEAMA